MTKFLKNINLEAGNDVQFKTTAGANAGNIAQSGDDLVISNPVGDILLGNGSDDVYIGDGTNTVDIRFEQNMAIFADSSSTRTLTLGGTNTNLVLESPTISGTMTLGATTINNKLTFTGSNGYIVFDYEPSGDTGEYSSEVPLMKIDHNGTQKTILSRVSENAALQFGHDDTVAITAGDIGDAVKSNWGMTNENVVLAAEGGLYVWGWPNNYQSPYNTWNARYEFRFRTDHYNSSASDSAADALASNGLYLGSGSSTQFMDMSRNLKNIGTISSGAITSSSHIEAAQHFKATNNNISFHAGGTQVLNIDVNKNIYPSTDGDTDLGFSDSSLRFRNGYFTGELQSGSLDINGDADISGHLYLATTKELHFSGSGGDTYIRENAANNLQFVVGANQKLVLGNSGTVHYQHFKITDSYQLQLGTDADAQFFHTGGHLYLYNATGDITFRNNADGADILFQSDNGSGGDATYFRLDGSEVETRFHKATLHYDNVWAKFGDSGDLRIYHDGSNSYIHEAGTGALKIQASQITINNAAGTEAMLNATQDGAVNLYYNGQGPKISTGNYGPTFKYSVTGTTDGNSAGDIVNIGETTTVAGKIYYLNSSGGWTLADADAESTAKGMLAVALGTSSSTNGMLIRGMVTLDHDPGTVGDTLFLHTTAGQASSTAPSGNGDIVRVIGYCLDSTNGQIYFNPDGTFVEVTA